MANDERPNEQAEEREFLAGLKARTGRDLAEWMAAIAAQGFQDKNEIIDWLRIEGLPFARASWLERIHRNGGKPIHAGSLPGAPAGSGPAGLTPGHGGPAVSARPASAPPRLVVVPSVPPPQPSPVQAVLPPQRAPSQPPVHVVATPPAAPPVQTAPVEHGVSPQRRDTGSDPDKPHPPPKPAKKAPKPPPLIKPPTDPAVLEKLVATAKGYRPLYNHLEAQIRRAIPGVIIAARDRYVAFGAPLEFAAVTLHPTEIRLGLSLGDRAFDARLLQARLRGPGPGITHMVVLTDARQVNDELLGLLKAANALVNAGE
jgi:predicted transport protein